jgi:acetyl esterase/lipase
MEQLPAFGTHIFKSVQPTFELYASLLRPQLSSLLKPVEHSYGEHERQKVDVYRDGREAELLPVVVFVHGGGLNRGDKRMPIIAGAHQNVGSFFAKEGFLAVSFTKLQNPDLLQLIIHFSTQLVPNYRLAGDHPGAATFPSGAEDLSLLLHWLAQQQSTLKFDPSRIFLLGNSAGAVHTATFLYADALSALSPPLSAAPPLVSKDQRGLQVRAAVFLSMPAEFSAAIGPRTPTLEGYFGGGPKIIADRCPLGLRKKSKDQTEVLIALAELDHEDEILTPVCLLSLTLELRREVRR